MRALHPLKNGSIPQYWLNDSPNQNEKLERISVKLFPKRAGKDRDSIDPDQILISLKMVQLLITLRKWTFSKSLQQQREQPGLSA